MNSFIYSVSCAASDFAVILQAFSSPSSLSFSASSVSLKNFSTPPSMVPIFSTLYSVVPRAPCWERNAWWSVLTVPAISFTVAIRFTRPDRTSV